MFYYILNMKMILQLLSNFCVLSYEPQATSSVKFDNDCDVILCSKCNRTQVFME